MFKRPIFDIAERAQWTGETHTRRRAFRRMISLSHYCTFQLGKWFPNAMPMVYVVGYPKSATTWFCQLVSEYWKLPFPQHSLLPNGFASVFQGHEAVDKGFPTGVYVVRDGRDVLISSFFHLKNQYLAGGGRRSHRRFFQSINLDKPLQELLPSFIEHFVKHPVGCRLNWGNHVKRFFEVGNPRVVMSRYEDMLFDAEAELASLVKKLSGVDADIVRVQDAVARCSFKSQTSTKNDRGDQPSYYRNGQKGDWANYFTTESAILFDKNFGETLVLAGYEENSSWVDLVGGNEEGTTSLPETANAQA